VHLVKDTETDAAREVDVWVIDGRLEKHLRRRVGVRGRESDGELEGLAGVDRVGWAGDGRVPMEHVGAGSREGGDAGRGRGHQGHELGLEAVWRLKSEWVGLRLFVHWCLLI